MTWKGKEPFELAKEDHEIVDYLSRAESTEIFQAVLDKFFDSDVLRLQWSWADRLLNSDVIYPCCFFNNRFSDTEMWLTKYLRDYWRDSPILVFGPISRCSCSMFEFQHGAYFSDIYFKSSLVYEEDLFITNRTLNYLVCFTELYNLQFYGDIVPWIKETADAVGDHELSILWERSKEKCPGTP